MTQCVELDVPDIPSPHFRTYPGSPIEIGTETEQVDVAIDSLQEAALDILPAEVVPVPVQVQVQVSVSLEAAEQHTTAEIASQHEHRTEVHPAGAGCTADDQEEDFHQRNMPSVAAAAAAAAAADTSDLEHTDPQIEVHY